MKILSFAASNSTTSINKLLVTHAGEVFVSEIDKDADIEIVDLNDYEMPIYSPEREATGGVPVKAQEIIR